MKKTFHPNYYATRRSDSNCYRQPPQQHGGCTPGLGYRYRKTGYISNHRVDRPPERNSSFRLPNFVVQLHLGRRALNRDDVESLIGECSPKPENFTFYPSDDVAATIDFLQWTEARDALVWFWESCISGGHDFTPELISNVLVPSDRVELEGRLRSLFTSYVKGLMEGKEVKRWVEEKDRLSKEITRVGRLLKRPMALRMRNEHFATKKGLDAEKSLIEGRLKEFETAMECILKYLEENRVESGEEDDVPVFRFGGRLNWKQIHSFIVRERCRLEEGLPIYAYRREILRNIHHQQVSFYRNLKEV